MKKMSERHDIVILQPPLFLETGINQEQIKSRGHRCSCCHGTGWYWKEEGADLKKTKCPACEGRGKLTAVVTVEWLAEKDDNQE